jgi:hypothetical protein
MSIPFLEPVFHLVADFNFKRAMSLIAVISIIGTAAWSIDYYTDYTRISRLERMVSLIERLDVIERRGELEKMLALSKTNIVHELTSLSSPPVQSPPGHSSFAEWFKRTWPKFVAGGLPWFAVSLFTLPGIFKGEKNSLATILSFQFLTCFFGFVATVIPTTTYRVVDYVVLPWGIMLIVVGIPMSLAALGAFRKVRESSLQKAIHNNLRQLSAASDQYFLMNGVAEVTARTLIGPEPGKLIRSLKSVDGEHYDDLHIKQGEPFVVYRRSGDAVRYIP